MARGGKRSGAGRRRGSKNKLTIEREILARDTVEAAAKSGETPLEYMLRLMRDETVPSSRRDAMAVAAAPFIHPRLAAVEHTGEMTLNHEQALDELEMRASKQDQRAASH